MTAGFAYRIRDGAVTEALHHELPVEPPEGGRAFVDLFDASSMTKGLAFLRTLNETGIALDWELDLADGGHGLRMHVSGVGDGDSFIVIGADGDDIAHLLTQITGVNNDLTNRLRTALQGEARGRHVDETLDEMTRLNNDLTNLHRELARRTAELERANRRRNEMLGMAAHDLRTPLSVIMGFAELLERQAHDRLEERERLMLDRMRASSRRMVRLVEDLLDLAAIEAGELRLERRSLDLAALVRDSAQLELEAAGASDKRIGLTLRLPDDPVHVDADPDKLGQVLSNLLSNAVKYSHTDTTVHVRVSRVDDRVVLEIADEGQGIPADEQDQLFQPFGRSSVATTAGESSTGLGLAIVRRIVEGHGGRITVSSEVGVGSTFRVELPIERA